MFSPWKSGSFQVPEDEHDSSSEVSQADSLAALEPHARTYSVPSTDDGWDDDDCVALGHPQARDCLLTTFPQEPQSTSSTIKSVAQAKQIVSSSEINDKPQGAPLGASQENPIDIDQGQQQSINLDSDDDGPEILPIDPPSSTITPHQKGAKLSQQPAHVDSSQPSSALRRLSRDFGFDDSWLPQQQRYDQDMIDKDNGFFQDPDDLHEDSTHVHVPDTYHAERAHHNQYHDPSPYVPRTHVSFELPSGPSAKVINNPFDDKRHPLLGPDNSPLRAINVERTKTTPKITKALKRCPSPSDAALARTTSTPMSSGQVLRSLIVSKPTKVLDTYQTQMEGEWNCESNASDRLQEPRYIDPLSGPEMSSKPYEVGPFANVRRLSNPPGSLERNSEIYNENQCSGSFDSDRSSQYPRIGHQNAEYRPYSSLHTAAPRAKWEGPHESYSFPHSSTEPPYPTALAGDRQAEENPTRVNIADLVNQSAPASQGHAGLGQKRKAAEMEDSAGTTDEHTMAGALPASESEDMALPDAQPREQSTIPLQSLTQEETVVHDTLLIDGSIQPIAPPSANISHNGPARKRAKTSSSKVAGIGKFVSGIAVGVAGVVAAFIATIPASVREEALRELNSAK